MGRKLGCMAGYVGLALSLLGLCLYVARNPVRDLLGRAASAWVSRGLTGTLEIGALRGSLFSSLVLRDVVLRDQQGAEVARLDEVQLSYDLTALLTQHLVVQRVDIVRPRATLVQEPGGQWNIDHVLAPLFPASRSPAPAHPTDGKLPMAIVLQRLQIHDGQIAVQTPALPGVQSIALTAEGPPDAVVVRGQLSAAGGRFDLHGQLNTVATPWRYSGSLALTHVNLATLLHQELLQSDLNLQLHLEGVRFSPEALRGASGHPTLRRGWHHPASLGLPYRHAAWPSAGGPEREYGTARRGAGA